MAEFTQAERFLLEQVRAGQADAWAQLVDRYQGRLLAFARSRTRQPADAEDLVQETFISFVRALPGFREQASLETYLFNILRRKVIDAFRGRRTAVCLLHDVMPADAADDSTEPIQQVAGADPTASWYVGSREQLDRQHDALADALGDLVHRFQEELNFRDLKLAEMLFYGQIRNKDAADIAGVNEKQVALLKHRWLKQVRECVAAKLCRQGADSAPPAVDASDALLTRVWEEQRLSCPKRSTIGGLLLGTLDGDWRDYVEFHVSRLGCRFCQANLEDLRRLSAERESAAPLKARILESTVGFLRAR